MDGYPFMSTTTKPSGDQLLDEILREADTKEAPDLNKIRKTAPPEEGPLPPLREKQADQPAHAVLPVLGEDQSRRPWMAGGNAASGLVPMRRPGKARVSPKRRQLTRRLAIGIAGTLLLAASAAGAIGWWLDFSEEPGPADILVVLAGDYSRPLYAADLYAKGLAQEVWICQPAQSRAEALAIRDGVEILPEEEAYRRILIRRGVPNDKIRLYGRGIMSTVNEALALRAALLDHRKRILIVTSRHHARRSRWIFRRELPGADIRVVATPYESFTRKWWTQQAMARAAVTETAKMIYYLLGGRFISDLENTPHVR